MAEIRILRAGEESVLAHVASGVFDRELDPRLTSEFLSCPRHHLAVAIEDGVVIGMASAVHYLHPDKQPQLSINEIGVAPARRGKGLGRQLLSALLELSQALGCTEAWVLTDRQNTDAMGFYAASGGVESNDHQVMFTFSIDSNLA